jgi:hypothetical protein
LHIAHVPPPPQADGRKIFCAERVDNKVDPAGAITGFALSPFMMILTSPDWTSLDCAKRRIITSKRVISVKAMIDVRMRSIDMISSFSAANIG